MIELSSITTKLISEYLLTRVKDRNSNKNSSRRLWGWYYNAVSFLKKDVYQTVQDIGEKMKASHE
jgi:hypothetical protein